MSAALILSLLITLAAGVACGWFTRGWVTRRWLARGWLGRDILSTATRAPGEPAPPPPPSRVEPVGPSLRPFEGTDHLSEEPVVVERPSVAPAAEWRRLVELSMDLADRLRDRQPAMWDRLRRGLSEVGVETLQPDGDRYDVKLHQAVGREATDDPALHLTVASTERCGFSDHGRLLRRPEVVVYRMEQSR